MSLQKGSEVVATVFLTRLSQKSLSVTLGLSLLNLLTGTYLNVSPTICTQPASQYLAPATVSSVKSGIVSLTVLVPSVTVMSAWDVPREEPVRELSSANTKYDIMELDDTCLIVTVSLPLIPPCLIL